MNALMDRSVKSHRWPVLASCTAMAAAVCALAFGGGDANAATTFCPPGSGAGQCNGQRGVAVDDETGRVYVADTGNNRVNVFEADGSFVTSFGSKGAGPKQFEGPTQIAVDNDPASPSFHDVYVVDYQNFRVEKFSPAGAFLLAFGGGINSGTSGKANLCTNAGPPTDVCGAGTNGAAEGQFSVKVGSKIVLGTGPGGVVYVVDSLFTNGVSEAGGFDARLQRFKPTGEAIAPQCVAAEKGATRSLAVDSSGAFWLGSEGAKRALRKFSAGCVQQVEIAETKVQSGERFNEFSGLAVDSTDNLYSAQRERGEGAANESRVIAKYDSSGNNLSRFGYGKLQSAPEGLAFHASAEGDIYASDGSAGIKYLSLPDPGPIVAPESVEADPTRSVWAAIKAEINPEGKATSYQVDYVDKASFESEGGFASPHTRSSGKVALGASGFALHAGEAIAGCKPFSEKALSEGKCLKPETTYRYRVLAEDSEAHKDEAQGELTTHPPLEVEATFASEVGTDGATLNATLDPLGSEASGYFEYVDDASFKESGFAEAGQVPDVEAGEASLDFGAGEEALTRSATLFPLKAGTAYHYRLIATDPFATIAGPVRTLTTFAPAEAESCPANEAFRSGPGALLPDCRAYEQVSPEQKGDGDIKVLGESFTGLPAVLEQSALSGDKLAYGSQQAFGEAESAPYTSQYIAARGAGEWSTHAINPPHTRAVVGGDAELFDTEFKLFSGDLCDAWLRTFADPPLAEGAAEGFSNLYRRDDQGCGEKSYEALVGFKPPSIEGPSFRVELQGVDAAGAQTIFRANDALAPGASAKKNQLYESAPGGGLSFICVLPGGGSVKGPCTAGFSPVDEGGSSRLASVANAISDDGSRVFWTAGIDQGPIYMRENPFGEGAECAEAGSPCTIAVSKAGEEESGTPGKGSQYWGAAGDGSRAIFASGEDLYEFEVAGKTTQPIAGKVAGLVGMSEDARRVYFVSSEALAGGAAGGRPNLYLYEAGEGGGTFRFIAELSKRDVTEAISQSSAVAAQPRLHSSRVTPDGLHAAFMSNSPALAEATAGRDITDAASEEADAEVYLYDAGADEGAGKLWCASCNPTGARPLGENVGGETNEQWPAAHLPVWENILYAARVLSGDGSRLYFESTDRLVARDTNARQDVYQWEAPARGGCDQADASFSATAGGCVDLISSGQGQTDARFVDASPSGDDVFFLTLASLLDSDSGLADIYDARAGGGFPPPPAPPASCEGEACQSPPGAPDDPTPGSASIQGAGNAAREAPARLCAKPKVRRKGRCVARHRRRKAAHQGRAQR